MNWIHEQTSPLFRIMWVHNVSEPTRRAFDNNICAFHIGNGFILSVPYNLRIGIKSIIDAIFQADIIPNISPALRTLFNTSYALDAGTNKRYITQVNDVTAKTIVDELKRINYDNAEATFCSKVPCSV